MGDVAILARSHATARGNNKTKTVTMALSRELTIAAVFYKATEVEALKIRAAWILKEI